MLYSAKKFLCLFAATITVLFSVPVFGAEEIEIQYGEEFRNLSMPSNDELFSGYVGSMFNTFDAPEINSTLGEDFLSNEDKAIYETVKTQICDVAGGRRASTVFTVTYEDIQGFGVKAKWSGSDFGVKYMSESDYDRAFSEFKSQFNLYKVFYALLEDCPYELYWFDKTVGFNCSYQITKWKYSNGMIASVAFGMKLSFQVEKDYQSLSYSPDAPTVNISKTTATTNAVNNAMNIIYKYRTYDDYEKITAYKEEICRLVEYDHDAIEPDYERGYGDPWQLIYVFDGDKTTNVVCEGYSKAFQYLMDNSVYRSNKIECRSVQGAFYYGSSGGEHMWNVVTLDDGQHYIADLTNSDSGTVGGNGGLFLVGAKGDVKNGYEVTLPNGRKAKYYYSSSALELWGDGDKCPLTLFAEQYIPHNLANFKFADEVGIQETESETELVLEITRRTDAELPEIRVFSALYDKDGGFKGSNQNKISMKGKNKASIKFAKPSASSGEKLRLFIWTENLEPMVR